jgi:hypothetical protein
MLFKIKIYISNTILLSDFMADGRQFGEDGFVLELDAALFEAGRLQTNAKALPPDKLNSGFELELLKECARKTAVLDTTLATWPTSLPDDFGVTLCGSSCAEPTRSIKLPFEDMFHVYQSHAHAFFWNTQRALRIFVNSLRIRCLSQLQSLPSASTALADQLDHCHRNIESSTTDLCASIPFYLQYSIPTRKGFEEVTMEKRLIFSNAEIVPKMAAFLAWPLAIAVSSEAVHATRREWLRSILTKVADSLHDAALQTVVDRSSFKS